MSFFSSYWFKSSFYTISQRVLAVVFGILSFMLLVRIYSKADFGVWSLFLVITNNIIEVSKLGFLKNAHIKIIHSVDEKEKPYVNSVSFFSNVMISLLISVVLAIFAWFICPVYFTKELGYMLLFYAASSIMLSPLYQLQFMQAVEFDFRAIFLSTVLRQGLFALFVLVIYLTDYPMSIFGLAVIQFMAMLPALALSYFLSRRYLHFSKTLKMEWLREIFHFGKYTVGTNISNSVFKSTGEILISPISGLANVATYNNALRISNLVEVPALSLAEVMFPKSVQTHQRDGVSGVKDMYQGTVAGILCLILPFTLFVMVFAEPIVLFLSGPRYLDVVPIVRVTMLYSLVVPFTLQFGTVMDSIGMPRTNFILISITAVLAIVLNWITISAWGVMGAAIGTLAAYLFNFVAGQFILRKHVGVSFIATIKLIPSFYRIGFTTLKNLKNKAG